MLLKKNRIDETMHNWLLHLLAILLQTISSILQFKHCFIFIADFVITMRLSLLYFLRTFLFTEQATHAGDNEFDERRVTVTHFRSCGPTVLTVSEGKLARAKVTMEVGNDECLESIRAKLLL